LQAFGGCGCGLLMISATTGGITISGSGDKRLRLGAVCVVNRDIRFRALGHVGLPGSRMQLHKIFRLRKQLSWNHGGGSIRLADIFVRHECVGILPWRFFEMYRYVCRSKKRIYQPNRYRNEKSAAKKNSRK